MTRKHLVLEGVGASLAQVGGAGVAQPVRSVRPRSEAAWVPNGDPYDIDGPGTYDHVDGPWCLWGISDR